MPDSRITYTPHLALTRLPANYHVWAQIMNDNLTLLDAAVSGVVLYNNFRGAWTNSTVYAVGDTAVDLETALVWQVLIAHTSASIPTTFLEDRTVHSTYWAVFNSAGTGRGEWTGPNTAYTLNDFVVHGTQYAICIASHVSTASFDDDVAAGKWHILLDVIGAPPTGPATGDLDGTYPSPTIRNSVALTGAPSAPTAAKSVSTSQIATTAFVQSQLDSPVFTGNATFTGNPTAPTPPRGDNDTSIATTEFVTRAISDIGPPPILDPDAVSWWNSVLANGGVVSTAQIAATNTLITALRTAGAYALMDDIWLLANADSNSVAVMTSFKQRRLCTAVGTPVFSKRGVTTSVGNYLRSGFIPGTHAVTMTGSNMQVGAYCASDYTGQIGTAFGQTNGTNQALNIAMKTGGGAWYYQLNCANAVTGSNTSASGLSSVYRNGTTFGQRDNGADAGLYVPATNATVLGTTECYIGARNNGGAADQVFTGTVSLIFVGADLTLAREPAVSTAIQAYMVAIGALDTYVSASGSDTNSGSITSPLLTLYLAYTNAQAGSTIWLDGIAASPTLYTGNAGVALTINKSVTIRAINRRGAIVSNSTSVTNTALTINTVNGETASFIGVIFDPSTNASNTKAYCVSIVPQAITHTLNFTDCLFRGWIGGLGAISYTAANVRVNLTTTSCDFIGDNCIGAIWLVNMSAGSLNVQSCTITLTNQTGVGGGGINFQVNGPGVTLTVNNTTIDTTVKNGELSGTRFAVFCLNAKGTITNTTVYMRNTTVPLSGYILQINVDGTGSASEFPIDGSMIDNCYVYSEMSNGGHLFGIGIEGGANVPVSATKQNNCIISNNTGRVGGTCAPHGSFMGAVTNGKMFNNDHDHPGIVLVNKNSINTLMYNNTVKGHDGSALYWKGSTGGSCYDNTVIFTNRTGAAQPGMNAGEDTGGTNMDSSGVTFNRNMLINNGATGARFTSVSAGSSATFTNNTYQLNTGTLNATMFFYSPTSYTTFAAWKAAIEPTAASNFP